MPAHVRVSGGIPCGRTDFNSKGEMICGVTDAVEVGAFAFINMAYSRLQKPLPAFALVFRHTPPAGLLCVHVFWKLINK